MKRLSALMFVALLAVLPAAHALAFGGGGCGEGKCLDCHSLDKKEAATIIKDFPLKVLSVKNPEVPGLWQLDVDRDGSKYTVYMDYSKKYLIVGNMDIVRIEDKTFLKSGKPMKMTKTVDVNIPLADALVIGKPDAGKKVVVFTDPRCPFCAKLHPELKKAVASDPDLVFFVKLYPLKIHPDSYDVSKSIVCKKSMKLLEESLAKKAIPPPTCETDAIDKNMEIAKKLGIRSTPTLILSNGRIVPGFKKAGDIIDLVNSK